MSGGGLGGVMLAQDDKKPAIKEEKPNRCSLYSRVLEVGGSGPTDLVSSVIGGRHSLVSTQFAHDRSGRC